MITFFITFFKDQMNVQFDEENLRKEAELQAQEEALKSQQAQNYLQEQPVEPETVYVEINTQNPEEQAPDSQISQITVVDGANQESQLTDPELINAIKAQNEVNEKATGGNHLFNAFLNNL